MATVSAPSPESVSASEEQRFLLRAVDWQTYRKIAEALTGRHVRLTFDRGNLEFMTISSQHSRISRLIGALVQVLTEELELPFCPCGDMTCEREDLDRALEADEGFYIENEALIRGKDPIDLSVDPPPDLAVEVEVSRSSKRRMTIYAAMRVPEVWRCEEENVFIHQLGAEGQYVNVERSPHFPFLTAADLTRFRKLRTQMDGNALVRLFREWVREQIRTSGKQP
jgi:Uma2 family endonuclease